MLTFEEFFNKKKIDLTALKAADKSLFHEFNSHYELMGEKSFDHSKKFWFNKLRKLYPLLEDSIENTIPNKNTSQQKDQNTTPNLQTKVAPTGFKPRFKAPKVAENSLEESPVEQQKNNNKASVEDKFDTSDAAASTKPAGFKPRFKAGITKSSSENTPADDKSADSQPNQTQPSAEESKAAQQANIASKPAGFKPRFKAGITKSSSDKTPADDKSADSLTQQPAEENKAAQQADKASKPAGFKPRFKADITKSSSEKAPLEDKSTDSQPNQTQQSAEENKADQQANIASKPAGFKPRFKAGVTKSSSENTPADDKSADSQTLQTQPSAEENKATQQANIASKPAGFKPRFKAGITKTKDSSDFKN